MPNKWFAAILGLFFPAIAFVYLAKLKWALICFFLSIILGLADFFLEIKTGYFGFGLIFCLICSIQAYKLAQQTDFGGQRKWFNRWWGAIFIPATIFAAIFCFRSFLYEPYQLPSRSMEPTLNAGDFIYISKWGYGAYGTFGFDVYQSKARSQKELHRGDIVVFSPQHDHRAFIKRVIGLPGDTLQFSDKQLFINGTKVDTQIVQGLDGYDTYIETLDGNTYSVQYRGQGNQFRNGEFIVPESYYFMMGDNRDNSLDSRAWGAVPEENIYGHLSVVWLKSK